MTPSAKVGEPVAERRSPRLGPIPLPHDDGLWRGPDTVVVVGVWLMVTIQQLAVSLSRPKMYVPLTEGGQEIPGWASAVATTTNAGIVLLAFAVGLWQLRRAPWRRWPVLVLALAPWCVVVGRLMMLGRPPGAVALVLPAIIMALWFARPRLAVVEVLGHLTIATATISVLMGTFLPDAGRYARAAGAGQEKPIGPFGELAGPMLSGNDLGLVLVVGLAAVWTVRRPLLRWGGTAMVVLAITWSASRTAFGALVVLVVVALALRLGRAWAGRREPRAGPSSGRGVRWLAAGSLLVLAALGTVLPLLVHTPEALNNRGRLWAFTVERFGQEPLLGWGTDIFKVLATGTENLGGHASHAHNLMAHVLVTGGVVLVLVLGALLVAVAVRAVRQAGHGWWWATLFLAAFLAVAILEVPFVPTDRIRQYPFVAVPLLVILFAQPFPAAGRSRSSSAAV